MKYCHLLSVHSLPEAGEGDFLDRYPMLAELRSTQGSGSETKRTNKDKSKRNVTEKKDKPIISLFRVSIMQSACKLSNRVASSAKGLTNPIHLPAYLIFLELFTVGGPSVRALRTCGIVVPWAALKGKYPIPNFF